MKSIEVEVHRHEVVKGKMMRLCDFYCLEENISLGVQVSTGSGYSNCQDHCVKDASFRQCSPGFQISI